MATDYDVIVVGAGIFGSCTAYHCQNMGMKTLLLEQHALGHKHGSSHGMSRITRYAHTEPQYVPLVADSYKEIAKLEEKRGEKLWKKTGLLWVATEESITKISHNLKINECPHEVIKGSDISKRYCQFTFGDEYLGLIDPMGGVIYADKWLHAFQDDFKKTGGVLQENEKVASYKDNQDHVKVITDKGSYTTKKVIFTVGTWIGQLLPELKFEINLLSMSVCFWKAKNENEAHLLNQDHFPVMIAREVGSPENQCALPTTDYPGTIKVYYNTGDNINGSNIHPENGDAKFVNLPGKFIQEHIPVVDGTKAAVVDKCKYTMSPDEHYVLGHIPKMSKNIIVGGCGSGSGFKVAPGIGRALAEIAAGKPTTVDISSFAADRFF